VTMTLFGTATVTTTGVSNITILSLPQTATDLYMVASTRRFESNSPFAVDNLLMFFNVNGTGYSGRKLYGDGSSATSETSTSEIGYLPSGETTANTFGSISIYLPNYTGSTKKSFSTDFGTENNATTARQGIQAQLWSNTSAITRVSVNTSSGTFAVGSTFSVYGITKGSDGIVTTS